MHLANIIYINIYGNMYTHICIHCVFVCYLFFSIQTAQHVFLNLPRFCDASDRIKATYLQDHAYLQPQHAAAWKDLGPGDEMR